MTSFLCTLTLAESTVGSIVSLLFFVSLFVGILVWLVVANRNGRFARDARLPLSEIEPIATSTAKRKEHTNG
ncbi:MAG: hypothetical protein SGJ11_14115 [Phycisphaerae bacterium]|nr:hypothetical protein [Phycisphaerae bacterium]